jgi:hypothetical protein
MRLSVELEDGTGVGRPLVVDVEDDGTVGAVASEIALGLRLFDVKSPSLSVVGRPSQRLGTDLPIVLADLRSGDRVELVEGRPGDSVAATGAATIVVESGPDTGRRIDVGPLWRAWWSGDGCY